MFKTGKRPVLLLMVVILMLCGHGNAIYRIDDITEIRAHNTDEDIIRFDDLDWLEERRVVITKIIDLLYVHAAKTRLREDNDGMIVNGYAEYTEEIYSYGDPIGNLAGWEIYGITIDYIGKEHETYRYAYRYTIRIIGEDDQAICDDISAKLDRKYSATVKTRDEKEGSICYTWVDDNDNSIVLKTTVGQKGAEMTYYCEDVIRFIEDNGLSKNSKGL